MKELVIIVIIIRNMGMQISVILTKICAPAHICTGLFGKHAHAPVSCTVSFATT